MPAWYDILGLGDRLEEPAVGAEDSRETWVEHVESEASQVGGRDRVVLGGFSQGGAMALYSAMCSDMLPLVAGVVCLSGYLPNVAAIEARRGSLPLAISELPVLLCHGTDDSMVSLDAAKRTRDALESFGLKQVELRTYKGMGHEICLDELDHVEDWMKNVLPPVPPQL